MSVLSYKEAGVDIEKADDLVARIKTHVASTYGQDVVSGVGGFACLYRISEDKLLAAGTDGVGTKLKIAQQLNQHDTIGIDLVAMCVNDILCTGARPLFFMDYLATGALDVRVSEDIIKGIVDGCKQSDAALIGGETAEMPGMYQDGEYDLAGFAVGEVLNEDIMTGDSLAVNDTIIGLSSSGFHANGYSLLRKLVDMQDTNILQHCLTPTRIYWPTIKAILKKDRNLIKGMAHITGGGLLNIARINADFDYHITAAPDFDQQPAAFQQVLKETQIDQAELYRTFNMGVGFALITDQPEALSETLTTIDETFWTIGHVATGQGNVYLNDTKL